MTTDEIRNISIYLHIPFCKSKCNYCSYSSGVFDDAVIRRYLKLIKIEFSDFFGNIDYPYRATTLYIGGGTPSFVPRESLVESVLGLYELIPNIPDEVTIEANPGDVDVDFVNLCKSIQVSRISLGVQSFNDRVLKYLGRRHTSKDAIHAFELLRNSGFGNISIDLIHGVPGFDLIRWQNDLDTLIRMNPDHVSIYSLSVDEGTPFYDMGVGEMLDPDIDATEYDYAFKYFKKNGYNRYEISNFSKTNMECRHNLNYWDLGTFIGFGPDSASHVDSKYFHRIDDVTRYIDCLERGGNTIDNLEELNGADRWHSAFIFGMRLQKGINTKRFYERFGIDLLEETKNIWRNEYRSGLVVYEDENLKFSDKAFYVSNNLLAMVM